MAEKVTTGMAGLDKALQGGIPRGNIVLLSGGAGTGKSTLCMQYLIEGAKKGEKGLYVSTEQTERELRKMASGFGWDVEGLQKKNMVQLKYLEVTRSNDPLQKIYELYTNFQPKRIVIDSLTTLTDSMFISDLKEDTAFSMVQVAESVSPIPKTERIIGKTMLYHLIGKLKLFDATVIMTSELYETSHMLSADGISEFIADGVFVLKSLSVGATLNRTIDLKKMRYTEAECGIKSFSLTNKGIVIE